MLEKTFGKITYLLLTCTLPIATVPQHLLLVNLLVPSEII